MHVQNSQHGAGVPLTKLASYLLHLLCECIHFQSPQGNFTYFGQFKVKLIVQLFIGIMITRTLNNYGQYAVFIGGSYIAVAS